MKLLLVSREQFALQWPYLIGVILAALGFVTSMEVRMDASIWSFVTFWVGAAITAGSILIGGRIQRRRRLTESSVAPMAAAAAPECHSHGVED